MMERLVRALSESDNSERQGAVVVVPETADAALLAQPLRCLADVEAIERTPLDRRLGVVDISQRIALGFAARDPCDTASANRRTTKRFAARNPATHSTLALIGQVGRNSRSRLLQTGTCEESAS